MELKKEVKLEAKVSDTFLGFKKLHIDAKIPTRAHEGDAGMDVYTTERVVIGKRSDAKTGLGLACEFPPTHALLVFNKSGRATRMKLDKGAEVIDSSYRGEIHIHLFNHSDVEVIIPKGEKIAQLLLIPIWAGQPIEVKELSGTSRGEAGFGSTGVR
jgi:dUTP pyrophosphatase